MLRLMCMGRHLRRMVAGFAAGSGVLLMLAGCTTAKSVPEPHADDVNLVARYDVRLGGTVEQQIRAIREAVMAQGCRAWIAGQPTLGPNSRIELHLRLAKSQISAATAHIEAIFPSTLKEISVHPIATLANPPADSGSVERGSC